MDKFHDFFMSSIYTWCNSHQYIVKSFWWSIVMCFFTTVLLKIRMFYMKKKIIIEEMCAAVENYDTVTCVMYLKKYPQYINSFAGNGYTPFLIACANGNTQIVKIMLKNGADINKKSKNEESPFYLATFFYIRHPYLKNASCIRELYYAGANIDAPNGKGLVPLQMAAAFGHTPLVKWLLKKNASGTVKPDPYLIASSNGHRKTAEIIWIMTRGKLSNNGME